MPDAKAVKQKQLIASILCITATVISILVLIAQGAILDYYLISNNPGNKAHYAWIVCDVVALVIWLYTLIRSYIHLRQRQNETQTDGKVVSKVQRSAGLVKSVLGDELRFIYICWLVYACCLVPRVAYIFKTIANYLKEEAFWGPNTLKITVSLAAVLFLFLVYTHHDKEPNTTRIHYLSFLTGTVTFNILDSCQMLDMLFITETEILLTYQLENTILAFACVNFFLPVLALIELRQTSERGKTTTKWYKFIYCLCHIFLTNLPYFIIRSYLWHGRNSGVSTYLTKNVIMLVLDIHEFFSNLGSFRVKICKLCKSSFFHDKFIDDLKICDDCKVSPSDDDDGHDTDDKNEIRLREMKGEKV
ncbi:transmembrane protein 121B-like [Ptychodera flava]|uniref:transmembrane protein 121B-like n=1 Tax=Ptychodera flava TaxID=63121 RepID=UPI00396A1F15